MSDNKTFVQGLYAAFGRGDVPFILANVDGSVEWVSTGDSDVIPWGGARRGQQGALSYFQSIGGNLEFESFEPNQFAADGEFVFVRGRTVAKVKPTGRRFDSEWLHVFTIADGRVMRFQEFSDTAVIAAAFSSH